LRDTRLAAYDDLIENNLRRIRILEEMARSIYRGWFVNFRFPGHDNIKRVDSSFGPIPQGWEVKNLGELTAFLNRGLSPSYDESGDSIVINQKCIREQRISLESARRQAKSIPADKLVRFGDVLINSTGVGTLGRVAQVYLDFGQCTVDTHVTIVRPDEDADVDFFGCTLLSQQETFERLGTGATGQTELSRVSIANVQLAIPPTRIQCDFGEVVGPMRSAGISLARQIQNLRRTRDILLPRLLSGIVDLSGLDTPTSSTNDRVNLAEQATNDFPFSGTPSSPVVEIGRSSAASEGEQHPDAQLVLDSHQPLPIDQTDRSDVLAVIRQVFSDGQPRNHPDAIRGVAQVLGYRWVERRINDLLQTDLLTAVRRGILDNVEDELILLARSIADYDRDLLKRQFLAAVGRSWIERDDAIQKFCRWMGFRRTGPIIDETARSVIQGLLRESRLEADGPNLIRRSP
jgi:type I restriction enzyme S subunit